MIGECLANIEPTTNFTPVSNRRSRVSGEAPLYNSLQLDPSIIP